MTRDVTHVLPIEPLSDVVGAWITGIDYREPVPSRAPPNVPVGPVVNGSGLPDNGSPNGMLFP